MVKIKKQSSGRENVTFIYIFVKLLFSCKAIIIFFYMKSTFHSLLMYYKGFIFSVLYSRAAPAGDLQVHVIIGGQIDKSRCIALFR